MNTIKNIDVPMPTEEIKEEIARGIKDVYVLGIHIATMLISDYNAYNNAFNASVEYDAWKLYKNKENLKKKYPQSTIPDIIGYILSERLYNKEEII